MPRLQGLIFDLEGTLIDSAIGYRLYPGAEETLARYHTAGVMLGICTNRPQASTYRILNELGLTKYFEFVAGCDTFSAHKPHPDHLLGVITALDVPQGACVFVGDGLNDVRVAQRVGIPCVVVTHGYDAADFDIPGASAVIAGFEALEGALKMLGFNVV